MGIAKKLSTLFMIICLAVICLALTMPLQQEEAHAKVSKAVTKKAKTYKKAANKLFKVSGGWYCFSKKKVKTGLQKVGKEYYYFTPSTGRMLTKSCLKKVGSAYYYFNKKSGKTPALRSAAKELDGEIWFFKSNGKRYSYAYGDTGSADGNTAAGIIISEAGIKPDGTSREEDLAKAYEKIVKRSTGGLNKSGYQSIIPPDLVSNSWIGSYAKKLANDKAGNCYCYSALTYVTFKALGEVNTELITGKCNTRPGEKDASGDEYAPGDHAWVQVPSEDFESVYVYDSIYDVTKAKRDLSFCRKLVTLSSDKASMTIEGKDYIYYPEMTF